MNKKKKSEKVSKPSRRHRCGTGACAAVVAATENGLCPKGEPITVKVSGGDLIVTYDDDGVRLTGNAELAFTGVTTY